MELVNEEDLAPNQHKQFLKAQSAIELLNFDYAISLLHGLLKEEPGFLGGREILRAAQGARARGAGKTRRLLSVGMSKVKGKIKKDPLSALDDIEKRLDTDPYNVEANSLLFEAFLALGMPDMAAFGLQTIREGHPDNTKNLHKLGDHYLKQGNPGEAAKIYELIVTRDPTDGTARKKSKDASAQATMKKGGWESGADFRSLQKNADQAQELEAAGRKGATLEQMQTELENLGAKYAEDPENIELVRQIADLYERLERWEEAASYYDYAFSLSAADSTLQRKAEIARDKLRGAEIDKLAKEIAVGGDDVEDKKAQLEELRRASMGQQIEESRRRVEQNPTDPQLRFELGDHLFNAGEFREAIPHLQRAKGNPHIRVRATVMLARCYDAMNITDLAVDSLKEANGELLAMDNTKKDVLYTLGSIYEKLGDRENSLAAFKEIYNTDYDYRDVAQRVESSYGGD